MLHLFKLEWLKQKNYTVFKVVCIIYMIALPAIFAIGKPFAKLVDDLPPGVPSIDVIYMFPKVWAWLGYGAGWLSFFFLGFLSILMVTNEVKNKTMRQNIITGLNRKEFFISKLNFILVISALATLYYILVALAYGFTHNESVYLSTILKDSEYMFRVFLSNLGYMSFGLFLGMLIKRTGIVIVLYFAWGFFLEKIIRWGIHYSHIIKNKTIHFYPVNSFSDLTPFPLLQMEEAAKFLEKNQFNLLLSPAEAIVISSVYILLFLWGSYRILKKSNL